MGGLRRSDVVGGHI